MKRFISVLFIFALVFVLVPTQAVAKGAKNIHINVLLNTEITDEILEELGTYGKVIGKLEQIDALTMKVSEDLLNDIQALPYVENANPDSERNGIPIDTIAVEDFTDGLSTWNLDVINVTDFEIVSPTDGDPYRIDYRDVDFDGEGVYVAVLDTGLLGTWRQYFPEERIAEEYAISFGGGGMDRGTISTQPNKWEHDVNSHGTHVTSTIIGYSLGGTPINGVAPKANVIPVKVLNQNGSGWSSVVAAGITYIGDLKAEGGPLYGKPVVINMSLGGPVLDAVEKAAIDYAIGKGVIIVASAGNNGVAGMGYPGAYQPVISVAASGWAGEWLASNWWYGIDDPDPNIPSLYYITNFSSRELEGQDLDVAAPGSLIVGPYQLNMGQTSYYYLGGTSMASPHVAGAVALLLQKDPTITYVNADSILESTAMEIPGIDPVEQGAGVINVYEALNIP